MVAVRDWLCDALAPMAQRAPRRRSTVEAVRSAMEKSGELPANPEDAEQLIDDRIREQVRRPGRCNVSRAVSDLCRAGLLRRHYQGYRLDHKTAARNARQSTRSCRTPCERCEDANNSC